ncbi:hypothetical protein PTKU64_90640 (plasmid) [Paraburkholderia terrae]|uniref:Lipoprotein n=1 Tax=Paraburkholderia terrae TaxID=311230 RepID=A0ABN6JXP0_9BURK|nr:hypothetical protein [Paraburkholderia terrae]BCZ85389.1 hypothetical protein PTKU64_90640 [Paraburkholderia terrae]
MKALASQARWFGYAVFLCAAACTDSEPTVTPLTKDLVYECQGAMQDPNNVGEFAIGLPGQREYQKSDGSVNAAQFAFDNDEDFLEVCVNDIAGLDAGKKYLLTLVHVDESNRPIGNKYSWTLHLENTSSVALTEQCFKVTKRAAEPHLDAGTPVRGYWRILKTDRAIGIQYHAYLKRLVPINSSAGAPQCVM